MRRSGKIQRHSKRTQICDRLKVHLRVLNVRKTTLRVVTLRPRTGVAFSTNYFHETWHILSDPHGARLLARLMWGLSYQRRPGTLVLIHGEHIQPTPFGAEPSDPILLIPADLTCQDDGTLRALRRRLGRWGPPDCTLRWQTFSLDPALAERARHRFDWSREYHEWDWMGYEDSRPLFRSEQMFRRGGFVCYVAPPPIMRHSALTVAQMDPGDFGMDYYYLADADGEVQIFDNYHARRSAAAKARREVLANGPVSHDPQLQYAHLAARREAILARTRPLCSAD